jgi:hypothetical protein
MVGEFVRRLQPVRELVYFGPGRVQRRLIRSRKLHRVRIDAAHAMGVGKVEMRFRPFPPLRLAQPIGLAAELGRDEEVQQRDIFQIAAAILAEEVAQQGAARLHIILKADKARAALGGRNVGFGEHAADGAGVPIVGETVEHGLLPGVILGDGKGCQLLQRQAAVAVDLASVSGRWRQAAAAPHAP